MQQVKLSKESIDGMLSLVNESGACDFIYTRSESHILTPERIRQEVLDDIQVHGGRRQVYELQQDLDVDRKHIDKVLVSVVEELEGYHVVNNGEVVLTDRYLDSIMMDINADLQENGMITIGSLAQQFDFAVDFLRDVVSTRLGTILEAHQRGTILYTSMYEAHQRATIRGIVSAITHPTLLHDLAKDHDLEYNILSSVIDDMASSGRLPGTVRRGVEYIPQAFAETQRVAVDSFFQQNGYLDRKRAAQHHVSKAFEFLLPRFPDAVQLTDTVVSRKLKIQLDVAVEDLVQQTYSSAEHITGFLDARPLLPTALSVDDISELLHQCPFTTSSVNDASRTDSKAVQIAKVYVIHPLLLSSFRENLHSDAKKKAQQTVNGSAPMSTTSVEVITKKSSKTKRRSFGADVTESITPSEDELMEFMDEWFPDIADESDLVDALISAFNSEIETIYSHALSKAKSSLVRGDIASFQELRSRFEDRFDELYIHLTLYEQALHKLSLRKNADDKSDESNLERMEAHVMNTVGQDLVTLSMSFVVASYEVSRIKKIPKCSDLLTNGSKSIELDENDQKAMEKALPSSVSSVMFELWDSVSEQQASVADVLRQLPAVTDALRMPLRKLDRKKEKQAISTNRQQAINTLSNTPDMDVLDVLTWCLQLLVQQCMTYPLCLSSSDIIYVAPTIVRCCLPSLKEDIAIHVQRFVQLAKQMALEEEYNEEEWKECVQIMRRLVTAKNINHGLA